MLARAARSRSAMLANHLRPPVSSFQPVMATTLKAKRTYSALTSVHTNKAYAPFAHYSQAIKTSPGASHIYLSGQIPADPSGALTTGSMADKTKAILRNTESVLKEAGAGLDGVVKVVVYLKDARSMPEFAKVYDAAFPHRPARSMVEASALPAGVDIQVDFIAVC